MHIHERPKAIGVLIRTEEEEWREKEVMPKALKPNETFTTGGDSLIRGESCNTALVMTVRWGKVRELQSAPVAM